MMATELSSPGSPPPVIPKLLCEQTDLTWPSTRSSFSFPSPTDDNPDHDSPDHHISIYRSDHKHTKTKFLKKNKGYRLVRQQQIKNSLLAGVGYLELANVGDFAANVWNQIPVPRHAMILMAIGGPIALGMTFFAARDFVLSWRNVRLLRAERGELFALRAQLCGSSTMEVKGGGGGNDEELVRALDSRLGVGVRELGTEIVDRMVMDVLMGIGALLVGVGTIMAIFGANPHVYLASNLLSGYVGNSMAAIFGLFNAIWSGFLIYRFQCHDIACQRKIADDTQFDYSLSTRHKNRLRTRFRRFQWHAIVNALNGLVAGAASMITATRWWGYVILIPCIISLILCNYFWRWKLGYDRPIITSSSSATKHPAAGLLAPLLPDLEYVSALHDALSLSLSTSNNNNLPRSIVNLDSFESMLAFISRNHMFESFCEWLLHEDQSVFSLLLNDHHHNNTYPEHTIQVDTKGHINFTLSPKDFITTHAHQPDLARLLLDRARGFIRDNAKRVFAYRERYLLELVGYAVWRDRTASS